MMNYQQPDLPHILFLFSDTGGGHRSAAEAIIEAIHLEYPGQYSTEMIDIFREYAPPPLDKLPDIYPPLSRIPRVWGLGYQISNGRRRTRAFYQAIYPYVRRFLHRLLDENPSDMVVSVHGLVNTPLARTLEQRRIPFVTVVTDMVSTHSAWYSNRATRIIVPTDAAYERGLKAGVPGERMQVIGMPVAERFALPSLERPLLRERLGWSQEHPVILMVGGGEGMGPLEKTAIAIDALKLPATLAVICGRNRGLKARLEAYRWKSQVFVYGFVREMPDFMRAADILVTKAGPGTISEAFIAGLPMILYSRMPGQEDGNVTYVVNQGAGIWAPQPADAARAVKRWLDYPEERWRAAGICQRLARPHASREIARSLIGILEKSLKVR